jgi:hypothetical protein
MTIIYIGKMDTWQSNRGIARFDIDISDFSRSLALRTGPSNNWGGDANGQSRFLVSMAQEAMLMDWQQPQQFALLSASIIKGVYVYENGALVSQALANFG